MNTHMHPRWMTGLKAGGFTLALIALMVLGRSTANAQGPNPPERLAYQGYLTDQNGSPLGEVGPENFEVEFRIFRSETGTDTDELWAEWQTVTVDNGYFSVMLGEGSPIGSDLPLSEVFSGSDASERWVEITVRKPGENSEPITPRLRLLTSPYSFLASKAQSMDASGLVGTVPLATMDSSIARRDEVNTFSGTQTISGRLNVQGTQAVGGSQVADGYQQQVNGHQRITGNQAVIGTVTANSFSGGGTIPVGGIIMWSGLTVPNGWALCDGRYGTPNLMNRFVYGGSPADASRAGGVTGGAETVELTENQMPQHSHQVNPPATDTFFAGEHSHEFSIGEGDSGDRDMAADGDNAGGSKKILTDAEGDHRHRFDIVEFPSGVAGNGEAHENMPPYYVLAFIMRMP